jgi:hypothetical protein
MGFAVHHRPGDRRRLRRPPARHHPAVRHVERRRGPPDGATIAGWPKFTGGWTLGTRGVGNLEGDGSVEVAVTTREGYLPVWDTPRYKADVQVATWHHDTAHTGRFEP